MEFTQIKETCLYVSDLDRTSAFYSGKLGLPIISRVEGRHLFFRAGSSVLLCFIAEATRHETQLPPHFAEGKQHLAFEVRQEDYERIKSAIENEDIRITHVQTWKNDLNSFYFEDPDGHVLEIVPPGIWD